MTESEIAMARMQAVLHPGPSSPRTKPAYLAALKHNGACGEAIKWATVGGYATLPEAWAACNRGDWMLWLLARVEPQRTDLFPVVAVYVERALSNAANALDSAANAPKMLAANVAALRAHAVTLRDLRIDSSDAAWAAGDAAGAANVAARAANAAARAAGDAAGAAESKWQTDYIRTQFACPVLK